jgi:hypothetical protein
MAIPNAIIETVMKWFMGILLDARARLFALSSTNNFRRTESGNAGSKQCKADRFGYSRRYRGGKGLNREEETKRQ